MTIDMNAINIIFVISLSLLAVSLVVFLIFFVPVLIQITKTLEAVQSLMSMVRDYAESMKQKVEDAGKNLNKFGEFVKKGFESTVQNVSDSVFK